MNGEAKRLRPEAQAEGDGREAKPYEPPAIAWEEELKAIAAASCATLDPFDCQGRPSV